MRKLAILLFIFSFGLFFSQRVTLKSVEKKLENKDDFLYRITDTNNAVYLAELEVDFWNKDFELFSEIYQMAKSVGANAYQYVSDKELLEEEKASAYDKQNYRLKLYYLPSEDFKIINNQLFVFGDAKKEMKIRINDDKLTLKERTYFTIPLEAGQDYKLATRQLLGTSMRFVANGNEKNKYYKITTSSLQPQDGFLSFKSSDIIAIDKSFGDFLTLIYQEVNF